MAPTACSVVLLLVLAYHVQGAGLEYRVELQSGEQEGRRQLLIRPVCSRYPLILTEDQTCVCCIHSTAYKCDVLDILPVSNSGILVAAIAAPNVHKSVHIIYVSSLLHVSVHVSAIQVDGGNQLN